DLTNKIAMVTGGAYGIGQGIVKTLAKAGAKVMICDIDEEAGQATAKEVGGEFYKLDVTDKDKAEEVVQSVLSKHERIDILTENTENYPEMKKEDMNEEDWDKIKSINLKRMFFIAKPVLTAIKEQNYGPVILTSYITGDITGYPGGSI